MTEAEFLGKIQDIFTNYPKEQWLDRCTEVFDKKDMGAVMSMIEIETGGDIEEIDDMSND